MDTQNISRRIVDDLFLLKQRCAFRIEDLCAESGLTPRELAGVESLASGECVSGNELSRRMEISPSRGSRVIARLIGRGLLVRETDPRDRRAVLVSLSARGVEQQEKVRALKDECETLLRSKITGEQLARVREGLGLLLGAL